MKTTAKKPGYFQGQKDTLYNSVCPYVLFPEIAVILSLNVPEMSLKCPYQISVRINNGRGCDEKAKKNLKNGNVLIGKCPYWI
jgi:hypothetical protein